MDNSQWIANRRSDDFNQDIADGIYDWDDWEFFAGDPQPFLRFTVEQLKEMNIIGVYRKRLTHPLTIGEMLDNIIFKE